MHDLKIINALANSIPEAVIYGKVGLETVLKVKDVLGLGGFIRKELFEKNWEYIMRLLHSKYKHESAEAKLIIKDKLEKIADEDNKETITKFILIIEQQNSTEKNDYLYNLFYLMSRNIIDLKQFDLYIEILNDIYTRDLIDFVSYVEAEISNKKIIKENNHNSDFAGVYNKFEPILMKRIARTGFIDEYAQSGLSQDGKVSRYALNNHGIHFFASINGNIEIYKKYIK